MSTIRLPRLEANGTDHRTMAARRRVAAHRRTASHAVALQKGLRIYHSMFERGCLPQLIADFPSFRIDEVNTAFCTMTGFSAADLVGSSAAVIFPPGRDPFANTLKRLADPTTDGYSAERLLQRPDGTTFPVLSTVSAVRDASGTPVQILVLMQDLTQQRVTEEAQSRNQALIDAAIATLPVAFSTFDSNLRLTFVAGGREVAGSAPGDYLGMHVSEITSDPAARAALEGALAGNETTTRATLNGETYLALNAPLRDEQGVIVGAVVVSSNITPEVSAEVERRRADDLRLFAARHDPLTGLLGRSGLVEHLNDLEHAGQSAGALLLLDLDDFHLINDSLGQAVGDAVLLEVASRVSDAFPGLVVARHGGDEFAVVAPLVVERAEAVEAAERVRGALSSEVGVAGHALRVTASVGVALEQTREPSSTLIRNADSALWRAKTESSGEYRMYDAEMRRQVRDRLTIQDGLREALTEGQLRIVYQPIVALADRRIVGSEALLRWVHTKRGDVPPAQFIPIAEQSGLIVPIGQWVMNTACQDALRMQRDHRMYVSVNVSARQLIGGGFAEWVEEVLERTGLHPGSLTVEMTESALMDNVAQIRTAFNRLRSRGVRVAIDDFGTGYSSLARLQRLPVDVIKLDRAFVTGVDVREEARGMAAAILQLSAAIGAGTVVEGVETEAESATLIDIGYVTGQGYLFGRPMSFKDLTVRLGAEVPAGS